METGRVVVELSDGTVWLQGLHRAGPAAVWTLGNSCLEVYRRHSWIAR